MLIHLSLFKKSRCWQAMCGSDTSLLNTTLGYLLVEYLPFYD